MNPALPVGRAHPSAGPAGLIAGIVLSLAGAVAGIYFGVARHPPADVHAIVVASLTTLLPLALAISAYFRFAPGTHAGGTSTD
jgi:hypothetical protein